jgi:hypothetical protein
MNLPILKKCLEEITKETPDVSYIRGMLETLIQLNVDKENQEFIKKEVNFPNGTSGTIKPLPPLSTGTEFMDAYLGGVDKLYPPIK